MKQGVENRLLRGSRKGSKKLMAASGPPGSPQTLTGTSQNFFDSYLNMGKFTLDWIKTNCSGTGAGLGSASYDVGALAGIGVINEMDANHSETYFLSMLFS